MTRQNNTAVLVVRARSLANHLSRFGGLSEGCQEIAGYDHIGATICDAILQAGLNYFHVVRPRVEGLRLRWPKAVTLRSFKSHMLRYDLATALAWRHPEKLQRIGRLTSVLIDEGLDCEADLRGWLREESSVPRLLSIHGIGRKTVDYLRNLVGVPAIAIDRHLRAFVNSHGPTLTDYDTIQKTLRITADFLDIGYRELDQAVWQMMADRRVHRKCI